MINSLDYNSIPDDPCDPVPDNAPFTDPPFVTVKRRVTKSGHVVADNDRVRYAVSKLGDVSR